MVLMCNDMCCCAAAICMGSRDILNDGLDQGAMGSVLQLQAVNDLQRIAQDRLQRLDRQGSWVVPDQPVYAKCSVGNRGKLTLCDTDVSQPSGYANVRLEAMHGFHAKRIGSNIQCMWCHTAVPHGWKNKALLVNLNDVGPEAGQPPNTEVAIGGDADVYSQEPYYFNAKLKVRNFAESGDWVDSDCGSAGANIPGNNTEIDKVWMGDVCSNPP